VTTTCKLVTGYGRGRGAFKPFIPMPVVEVEGINKLVVPLLDSRTVLLGWFTAAAPELFVPVEYSWRELCRLACSISTSSLVRLLRSSLTLASVSTVRDILGREGGGGNSSRKVKRMLASPV
jgi:hypothetical protein